MVFDQNLAALASAEEKLSLIKFYQSEPGCLFFHFLGLRLGLGEVLQKISTKLIVTFYI